MTQIVASDFTKFGKREEDLITISAEASRGIVEKFGDAIDFIVVSNAYSGEYVDVSGLNNLLATRLSLDSIPSIRVDNTSGSGGSALITASALIESGTARNVLVVGTEKMTGGSTKRSSRIIASLLNDQERRAALSLPSLAAFMTKSYLKEFDAVRESIAQVSVKNHRNGSMNPYAHFQKPVTLDQVMESKVIADPLHIFEYCPVSDGAVATLLSSDEEAPSISGKRVKMVSSALSSSSSSVSSRESMTSISCVRNASTSAFRKAEMKPADIDVAEFHDMATILEIVETEDAGFFPKGEGWKAVISGETEIGGSIPINTSGGLNSKGHPIGATGVAQAGELFMQLTGSAGQRQVKNAHKAFALNMSGFGNSASAIIYEVVS